MSDQPKKRIKNRRLAEDGLPSEMFQDVKRACHKSLLSKDPEYEVEQERIAKWCSLKGIKRR